LTAHVFAPLVVSSDFLLIPNSRALIGPLADKWSILTGRPVQTDLAGCHHKEMTMAQAVATSMTGRSVVAGLALTTAPAAGFA
jgi:hypothetical protein